MIKALLIFCKQAQIRVHWDGLFSFHFNSIPKNAFKRPQSHGIHTVVVVVVQVYRQKDIFWCEILPLFDLRTPPPRFHCRKGDLQPYMGGPTWFHTAPLQVSRALIVWKVGYGGAVLKPRLKTTDPLNKDLAAIQTAVNDCARYIVASASQSVNYWKKPSSLQLTSAANCGTNCCWNMEGNELYQVKRRQDPNRQNPMPQQHPQWKKH